MRGLRAPVRGALVPLVLAGSALAATAACGGSGDISFGSSQATSGSSSGSGGDTSSTTATSSATSTASSGGEGGAGASGPGGGGQGGAPATCGDGDVDSGEACDGADFAGKTCVDYDFSSPGTLACTNQCNIDAKGCKPTCDGVKLEPGEQCDGTLFNGLSCVDYGYSDPVGLACVACEPDTSNCKATCGDDKKEEGELCDGQDTGGQDCTDFLYVSPQGLACQPDCAGFDTSGCTAACNGTLEPGELCDGNDLNGHTCLEFGFGSPAGLKCTACALDPSGCTAVCGNGTLETGEECDDSNTTDGDGCSALCKSEGTTCANALQVGLDVGPSTVIVGSTLGGGQHTVASCPSAGADRVYAVTTAQAGFLTASLKRGALGTPTDYDSTLYAADGCDASDAIILCANSVDPNGNPTTGGGEVISFPVKGGSTTYVWVDGATGQGAYELTLDLSTGFNCFDPVPIPIAPGGAMTLLGSTPGTTNTQPYATCGGQFSEDVVYEITRTENGKLDMLLDPTKTTYDSVLFARPTCDSNTNAVCQNVPGNGGELINLPAVTGGNPFYLWVDGYNGANGSYGVVVTP